MQPNVWGLQKNPFPCGLDTRHFYDGTYQLEALARLRYLVDQHRRLGVLVGGAGVGKSMLLQVFAEKCRQAGHAVAHVNLLGESVRELYWQLAAQLRAAPRNVDDSLKLWQRLEGRLIENQLQAIPTIVLLDDADQAGPDVEFQVVRLLENPAIQQGNLTIVLTGSTRSESKLGKRLTDLVELRVELEPWEEADTVAYLQFALLSAGADRPLFEEVALVELHHLAGGVPRRVNRLAEYALLAGASVGLSMIDAALVREVHESLNPEVIPV